MAPRYLLLQNILHDLTENMNRRHRAAQLAGEVHHSEVLVRYRRPSQVTWVDPSSPLVLSVWSAEEADLLPAARGLLEESQPNLSIVLAESLTVHTIA